MNQKTFQIEPAGKLIFQGFPASLLFHAVFNRHHGVSPPPCNSRNVSFGISDNHDNVLQNREKIKKSLGGPKLVSANQVHGAAVYVVRDFPSKDIEINGFDALVTNVAGVGLMIQQADCQAVLLFDPAKNAIGIVHAGWRGTVAEIIAATITTMGSAFGSEPADLQAAVSPSLGPCCAEFINYHSELPAPFHDYQVRPNYFDFWAISHDQLSAAGVRPANISIAEICTCCDRDYFSYRRDRQTGRFGSVIGLRKVEG